MGHTNQIQKKVLANNVTFVSQRYENARTVAVGFYFSVGSRYEKDCDRGVSHFCEHLLFKGTVNRSRRDISCAFDRMGGQVNAFTERDDVCMYAQVPSSENNFKQTMDILCDMACNCIFPDDEIDKERSVVENEILAVEDDCEESSLDVLASRIWNGCGLSQTITGSIEDLERLDRKKICEWYDKYFVHGELSVFVCGNFDESYAEKILEQLPNRENCSVKNLDGYVWNGGNYFEKSGFSQQQVYVSYPIRRRLDEKSYWALTVLNAIIGDSMGSRLFESLRERNGLCYSVYSFFSCYDENGVWSVSVSCDKKNLEKSVTLIKKEIEDIAKNGVLDCEIEDAKGHLCGEEIMGDCDMEYAMRRLQKNFFLGLPLVDVDQVVSSIRAVQKNDIIETIGELFSGERAILIYGGRVPKTAQRRIMQ